MKSWFKIIIIGIVIAALFIFTRFEDEAQQKDSLLASVQKMDFAITLHTIGLLDAAQSHMISSAIQGTGTKIVFLVEDGTKVKEGDVLVRFDPSPFEKEVKQWQGEVESLQAAVQAAEQSVAYEQNQVQREVADAEYRFKVAGLELKRLREGDGPIKLSQHKEELQKAALKLKQFESFLSDLDRLRDKGFDNPGEISRAQEEVVVYREKHAAAQKRLQNYKDLVLPALLESARAKKYNAELMVAQIGQGGKYKVAKVAATLIQIKGKLRSAEVSLQQARKELEKTVIYAPFGGIVIHYETFREGRKRKPREGDSVIMNQPILYLPDISRMIVKTKVREVDLHKIELGQKGIVQVDAYPDTDLKGTLIFIGALAAKNDSVVGQEKYFQVVFEVDENDNRLRPGMTARISIIADKVSQVLAVPVQAIFDEDGSSVAYVWKKYNGFETREVAVGRQNEDFAEILGGLSKGEKVSMIRPEERDN